MLVRFDSTNITDKSPFGAVPTGESVSFKLAVKKDLNPSGVSLCVRLGEKTEYLSALRLPSDGEYVCFSVDKVFNFCGIYYYRFEIYADGKTYYVGRGEGTEATIGEWLPEWQQTVYDSAYVEPDGFRGGIIYHVFGDRFCRDESVSAGGKALTSWGKTPRVRDTGGVYRAEEFFGGNLRGVTSKLDYVSSLGVNIIYMSPIFKAYSNHRYDTGDYFEIDPVLGSEEDFVELCREARKRGIKIILDGVFNHTGSDSKYFNKFGRYDSVGAWQGKSSPYYKWYDFGAYPCGYNAWWGIDNVPTVNKNEKSFQDMIYGDGGVIEKWTKLGADGWRLDVADELPSFFIEGIRKKLKSIKPEALLIGEVWEDASVKFSYGTYRPYLLGRELDGVMNYPFLHAVINLVKNGDAGAFKREVGVILENYPEPMLAHSMTILGTHDTSRILNVLSGAEKPEGLDAQRERKLSAEEYRIGAKRLKVASAIAYFLPGIPSVFYGDEAGVQGFSDPLSRPCYPWGGEDGDLLEHYQRIGKIRRENRDLFSSKMSLSVDGVIEITRKNGESQIKLVYNPSETDVPILGYDLYREDSVTRLKGGEFAIISDISARQEVARQ